jgi:hypothetical protein
MEVFIHKIQSIWNYLFTKGGIISSTILTAFLTAIGFPKQIIYFIIMLIVADVLTRWYAIVRKKYGNFNLKLFYKAWVEKDINSNKLKSGIFAKIFFYAILLIIAHQTTIVPELAFGKIISNFVYSVIVILDCISIVENMIDSGYSKFKPMLQFLKNKLKELIGSNGKTDETIVEIPIVQESNSTNESTNNTPTI